MTFAQKLESLRKGLNLTQPEAAELLEVSFRSFSDWERGKTVPLKITQEGAIARLMNAKPRK